MNISIKKLSIRIFLIISITLVITIVLSFFYQQYVYNYSGIYYYTKARNQLNPFEGHSLDKSVSFFNKAIAYDSLFAPAFANLAVVTMPLYGKGNYELAQKYFEKAISLCSDDADIYLMMFERCINQNLYQDSAYFDSLIARAVEIAPNEPEVYAQLTAYNGIYYAEYDRSISYLKKAVKLKHHSDYFEKFVLIKYHLQLHRQLSALAASIYFERQRVESVPINAIPIYDSLKWIPMIDNFYAQLAEGIYTNGTLDNALKYAELSLKHNRKNDSALFTAARVHERKHQYEKAIEFYTEGLKYTYWDKGLIYNELSTVYKAKGKLLKSIEVLHKAMKHGFSKGSGHFNIAKSYSLLGDKILMLDYLSKAISLDEKLVEYALSDTSFKKYWNDSDFIVLLNTKAKPM